MRIRQYFVLLVFSLTIFSSILVAQEESVKGYYDPANDWLVFEYVSPEYGPRKVIFDSPNKVDPIAKTQVAFDNSLKAYTYSLDVLNSAKAKQVLGTIVIKFFASIYDQKGPNADWDMGEYRTGRTDTWEWFNPAGIPADKMQSGFSYKSKGLPAIIEMYFFGQKRKRFSGPSPTYDPDEIHKSFDRVFEKLEAQYPETKKTITRKTVGPKDPPADFKPVEFLDYIINLKHQATSLGWIKNEGIMNSLDVKLENAKKKISEGSPGAAKNILGAFINEVEAQGCATYENCPPGKHLTSEAYALLKYNAQYLIDNLTK